MATGDTSSPVGPSLTYCMTEPSRSIQIAENSPRVNYRRTLRISRGPAMADETDAADGTQRQGGARNRASILQAAGELLAGSPLASMNEIAKRAGVGAG